MPNKCCVPFCKNTGKNRKLSFHQFPADIHRRLIWLQNIRRQDPVTGLSWIPGDYSVICSAHFSESQFKSAHREGRINGLHPTAIPTIFPSYPLYVQKDILETSWKHNYCEHIAKKQVHDKKKSFPHELKSNDNPLHVSNSEHPSKYSQVNCNKRSKKEITSPHVEKRDLSLSKYLSLKEEQSTISELVIASIEVPGNCLNLNVCNVSSIQAKNDLNKAGEKEGHQSIDEVSIRCTESPNIESQRNCLQKSTGKGESIQQVNDKNNEYIDHSEYFDNDGNVINEISSEVSNSMSDAELLKLARKENYLLRKGINILVAENKCLRQENDCLIKTLCNDF